MGYVGACVRSIPHVIRRAVQISCHEWCVAQRQYLLAESIRRASTPLGFVLPPLLKCSLHRFEGVGCVHLASCRVGGGIESDEGGPIHAAWPEALQENGDSSSQQKSNGGIQ